MRLERIQKIMAENATWAAVRNPDAAAVGRLNRNDAEFKSLGFAKEIVALNAQALILKITEPGDEVKAVYTIILSKYN